MDASCEDIDVDENMSFLNTYVDNALAAGAAPYSPPQKDDDDDIQNRQQKLLNTTPYATPTTPAATLTGLALSGIAGTYVYLKILEFYRRVCLSVYFSGPYMAHIFEMKGSVCLSCSLYWCSVSCFMWSGVLDSSDLLYCSITLPA